MDKHELIKFELYLREIVSSIFDEKDFFDFIEYKEPVVQLAELSSICLRFLKHNNKKNLKHVFLRILLSVYIQYTYIIRRILISFDSDLDFFLSNILEKYEIPESPFEITALFGLIVSAGKLSSENLLNMYPEANCINTYTSEKRLMEILSTDTETSSYYDIDIILELLSIVVILICLLEDSNTSLIERITGLLPSSYSESN